jgi:hypothetical protein
LGDGPPGFRRNFTCSAVLRIHSRENELSTTGLLPAMADLSRSLRLIHSFVTPYRVSYNPKRQASWFGLFPFRSPLLRESNNFFLFLQVLRCFSSLGLPSRRYVFTSRYCSITNSGFPHSEISGSKLTYSSPKHIGVSAVLLRLLVPRHPPCALNNLTYSFRYTSYYFVSFIRSVSHVH